MASPGQIQIYSPARQLPPGFTGRPAPAPVRAQPTPGQVKAGQRAAPVLAGRWSALAPYVQAQTAKKTQETADAALKKAEEKAKNDAYNQLPWYKKALVNTLDNPVAELVTAPLSTLSVPGKLVALGKEELSSHLPRRTAEWMQHPFGQGEYVDALNQIVSLLPASPFGVDTDKARAEKRGVMERIAPRSDFGHGQILQSTGDDWGDRVMGFGGDMLNDPLMLVEGGGAISRPAILAEDAAKTAGVTPKVITAAREGAEAAARNVAEREALASITGVDEGLVGARKAAAEADDALRRAPSTVIREEREIPIPKNRKGRATLATEWATENPELWRQHAGEVTKGVKQGFEAMSPEARAAFGVKTGGWEIKGLNIPGTEPIRQAMKEIKGVRRAAFSDLFDKIPGALDETSSAFKLRNMRAVKGAEGAFQTLRKEGATTEEKELALNEIFLRNQLPIGEGPMKARGNTFVRKALRQAKQVGPEATRQAITQAETQPGMNWVNKVFSDIADTHERITGKKLMSSIDRESYVPAVLDTEWRRNLAKTKDPAAQAYMRQSGIVKDDLLEASHFLDKKRKFAVPEGKTEQEFDFAGKKVTLKGNTIDDKNAALREAFPDWKGDFYSKDLNVIAETYNDSLARDAGARHARAQLAETASPYAEILDGMLWDEYETMNRALKQEPYARRVTDVTSRGYDRNVGLEDVAAAEPVPSSRYFRREKDKKLTEQLREDVQGAGHQWQAAARDDIQQVQGEARDVVEDLRKNWAEGLRESAKVDTPRIKELGKIVEAFKEKVRGFGVGKIGSDKVNEVARSLAKIDTVIADLEKEMSSRRRVWNGKITRDSKAVDRELAEQLRVLKGQRQQLEAHVEDVGIRLKVEIEERRAWINGDVPEKEAALQAKEATIPKPSPADPEVMDGILNRIDGTLPPPIPDGVSEFQSHPAYQRMVDDYADTLRALQQSKEDGRLTFKNGKLTPEGRKLVDESQAARKALREAQGSSTPAEFERVFKRHEKATVEHHEAKTRLRLWGNMSAEQIASDPAVVATKKEMDAANAELQRVYDIQKKTGRPFEQTINGQKVLTNADTDIVQEVGRDRWGRPRYKVGDWRIEPTKPETTIDKVRDTGPRYTQEPKAAPTKKTSSKPIKYELKEPEDLYDFWTYDDGTWTVTPKKGRKKESPHFKTRSEAEEHAKGLMATDLSKRLNKPSGRVLGRFQKNTHPRWNVVSPEGDITHATVSFVAAKDYALAGHLEDQQAPAFYFHGTPDRVPEFQDNKGAATANLFGPGTYTTENPDLGRLYRYKGMSMDEGEVYRVSGPEGKHLDLDKPLPMEGRLAFLKTLEEEVAPLIPPPPDEPQIADGFVRLYSNADPAGWWNWENMAPDKRSQVEGLAGRWWTTDKPRAMHGSGWFRKQPYEETRWVDVPQEKFEQLRGNLDEIPDQFRNEMPLGENDVILPQDIHYDPMLESGTTRTQSVMGSQYEKLYNQISTHGTTGEDAMLGFLDLLKNGPNHGANWDAKYADTIAWQMNHALRDEGFVAMKHTGGGRMGANRDHNVKIWLDPSQVKILDVRDREGSFTDHMRKLAKARGEFEGLGGADAYPNGAPPLNEPGVVTQRASDTSDAYKEWRLWQTTKEDISDMERQLQRGGKFHEQQQARNWATHRANYNNLVADATKEERAALDAAKAARDARAGQRESIIRSGPEFGGQTWEADRQAPVNQAREALAAKEASYTPPFSPLKTAQARRLEEEEARLIKWHEQGNMTTPAYEAEKKRIVELRSDALEQLTEDNKAGKFTKAEYRMKRAEIDTNTANASADLEERFSGRLNDEEFARRMKVIEDRRQKLQLGPKIADPAATEAAAQAARERVALRDQSPARVIGEDDIAEGVTKPRIEGGKVIKHSSGDYVVEIPKPNLPNIREAGGETVDRWFIVKDKTSKKANWKVWRPGDQDPIREFGTLREAAEYAQDDAARAIATTSAERRLLPPAEPGNYIDALHGEARKAMTDQEQVAARIEMKPDAKDVISADDWFRANVRAATGPEREAFKRARARIDVARTPSPRWMDPLGGFGFDERRLVGADAPKQLTEVEQALVEDGLRIAKRDGLTPEQAIDKVREILTNAHLEPRTVDNVATGLADHYYAQSGRGEPQISRHIERINTPPQPAAFETKAISAETGQLAGVPAPRTEGEAVSYLSSQISPVSGTITPGSDLHNKVVKPYEDALAAELKRAEEIPFEGAAAKERISREWGAERDAEVGALSEKHGVFKNLKVDLTERESLLRKRNEVIALRERLMAVPRRPKNDDLIDAVEELLAIAKANPNLDNNALNAAESLLHTNLSALQALEGPKQLMNQVKFLSNEAANKNLDDVSRAVLSDNWDVIHKGLLEKGDVIIDSRLAAAMQNMYNMQKAPGIVGRGFKGFTNLFKTYATLSPGFMTRNAMGGIFMNTADGVPIDVQTKAVGLWRKWSRGGEDWLIKQPRPVQEAFAATFASGAGGRVAEAGVAGKSSHRLYNLASNNPLTRVAQRGGEKIEGALRLAMAMHSIERGETVAGAVDRLGRVHFNYAEVSQFDESAKQMIPFWTFMSRNMPLQFQEMFTNPKLYSAYGHVQRNFSQPDAENTPGYWKGLGTWRLPFDFLGQPAYAQPDFGFNRVQQDITNVTDTLTGKKPLAIMSTLNPGFSAPLDFAYGKDSFTGRTYGPTDYSKMSGVWGNVEKVLASAIPGQTNEQGQVSDNFLNFMRSINPIEDRVNRLAPGAVGGTSDARRLAESYARFFGVPYRTLSPKQQENEAKRRFYALQDEYKRQGAMASEQAS